MCAMEDINFEDFFTEWKGVLGENEVLVTPLNKPGKSFVVPESRGNSNISIIMATYDYARPAALSSNLFFLSVLLIFLNCKIFHA